ncbi:hypothetical protein B0T25DRAFT_150242 [Lasiosphaeria hispida]|uniref:Aminoglycoside phosphotransferase domain-containing protein n=1 Tax=Lasiosphaeria hispida TaxID=260671 RepID=A0AAJ0HLT1_9PEZI|nr:hypothetical protein B0T25DRAFT_150242 [Lasiosphaeria hispida]
MIAVFRRLCISAENRLTGRLQKKLEKVRIEMYGKLNDPVLQHRVVHGDFGPESVLLPEEPLKQLQGPGTPMFIVDWEMCQINIREVDVGQMVAGLYKLFLYDKKRRGTLGDGAFCSRLLP